MKKSDLQAFTSWLGKRSHKSRLEQLGLERLQEIARENGKKGGRPKGSGKKGPKRRTTAKSEWVLPAPTRSGHIEKSSLKKHPKALKLAKVEPFPLYTFRHTCLTRWAAYMDPYTLAYLAGHCDFETTKRYVHPEVHTVRAAIERARDAQSGHTSGNTTETAKEGISSGAAIIN